MLLFRVEHLTERITKLTVTLGPYAIACHSFKMVHGPQPLLRAVCFPYLGLKRVPISALWGLQLYYVVRGHFGSFLGVLVLAIRDSRSLCEAANLKQNPGPKRFQV